MLTSGSVFDVHIPRAKCHWRGCVHPKSPQPPRLQPGFYDARDMRFRFVDGHAVYNTVQFQDFETTKTALTERAQVASDSTVQPCVLFRQKFVDPLYTKTVFVIFRSELPRMSANGGIVHWRFETTDGWSTSVLYTTVTSPPSFTVFFPFGFSLSSNYSHFLVRRQISAV